VLEINPRPSATMGLYEEAGAIAWPAGLVAVHLDACLHGVLPRSVPRYGDWRVGARTIFAPHAFIASAGFSNACIMDAGIRDVPMPGTPIAAGQPVCTALARARSLPALREALERRAARLLQQIAHSHEKRDDIVQFPC
jgi:predicted ATP-grasp superfamily ATP-dependent carboligase